MNKIPKIIHYCWFGGNPLSYLSKLYVKGWKKECPDYRIIKWSEKNFNVNKFLFTRKAYKIHNWAAVSDFVRLYVLYKYGGIYLDTDVQIIKSLNPLLKNNSFVGMEDYGVINNGLIYGSKAFDSNVYNLIKLYERIGLKNNFSDYDVDEVHIMTTYFHRLGFKYNNKLQFINGCTIYPTEYFCPENYMLGNIKITRNTYTFHHYFGSWVNTSRAWKIKFHIKRILRIIIGTKAFLFIYRKYMYKKKGDI